MKKTSAIVFASLLLVEAVGWAHATAQYRDRDDAFARMSTCQESLEATQYLLDSCRVNLNYFACQAGCYIAAASWYQQIEDHFASGAEALWVSGSWVEQEYRHLRSIRSVLDDCLESCAWLEGGGDQKGFQGNLEPTK